MDTFQTREVTNFPVYETIDTIAWYMANSTVMESKLLTKLSPKSGPNTGWRSTWNGAKFWKTLRFSTLPFRDLRCIHLSMGWCHGLRYCSGTGTKGESHFSRIPELRCFPFIDIILWKFAAYVNPPENMTSRVILAHSRSQTTCCVYFPQFTLCFRNSV